MYLGVHCSSSYAFFAVLEDAGVVADDPLKRVGFSSAVTESAAVVEFIETVQSETERISPEVVGLLVPIFSRPPGGPQITVAQLKGAYGRGRIQALVEAGLAKAGHGATKLTPSQIRTRLSLPRAGPLQGHIASVFPQNHPPYWADRRFAAVTAEAAAR